MMKERPDDKNLKAFVDRLTEQLAIAHKKEAKAEVCTILIFCFFHHYPIFIDSSIGFQPSRSSN